MNPLREREIMTLLETMDPAEIREQYQGRLDKEGLSLLDELAREMEAGEAFFQDEGQKIRDANPAPEIPLSRKKLTQGPSSWWQKTSVPNWVLVAAAILIIGFPFISQLPFLGIDLGGDRSGSLDLERIHPINEKLVQILIERAEFLMEAGDQKDKDRYYREALYDLLQANELDPDNTRVLSLLVRVHEKLGNTKKAKDVFEKWRAAQEEE